MTDEKRRLPRGLSRLVCFVKRLGTGGVYRALTQDLSGSGVRVVIDEIFEDGTPVEVEIKLPDREDPVRFLGETVWCKPLGDPQSASKLKSKSETGIKVISIDPTDLTLIKYYVSTGTSL